MNPFDDRCQNHHFNAETIGGIRWRESAKNKGHAVSIIQFFGGNIVSIRK